MASGQVRLTMAFNGEDKLAAVIEKSNRAMGKFGKNTSRVSKTATSGFARIKGSISGVGNRLTELNSGIQLARQAFGALQAAGEAAISGEIANNAEKVFNQISGGADNAAKIMEKLRGVSRGLLDDTTIQQFAGSLRIAGVEFSETARILDLSSRVALATGQDLETVSRKIKDAALAGRQGEFDRLGVVIKVNTELKKKAEAEGKVVEEMTKAEQVSMRMDILTEKLGTTMAAAGIDTSKLGTSLRSVKTDLDNLQSSAEQVLANSLTTTRLEQIKSDVRAIGFQYHGLFGDLTKKLILMDGSLSGKLQRVAGISEAELKKALDNLDSVTMAYYGEHEAVIEAILQARRDSDKDDQRREKEIAERKIEKENQVLQVKKDAISEIENENRDLKERLSKLDKDSAEQEKIALQGSLEANLIFIKEIEGANKEHVEHLLRLHGDKFDKLFQQAEESDNKRKSQARKAASARRKQEAEEAKRENERRHQQRRKNLFLVAESAQVKRDLELSFFQEDKDIKIRQSLELEDLEKRKNTKLNLLVASSEEERQLERDRFMAEEVTLARTHGEELAAVQKALSEKKFEEQQSEAERAAEALKKQREIFQDEMSQIAQATNLIEAPLTQLVDHQKGASDQMKALGGAALATSSAMNVYSNETDASASASERFKQGLPAMTHAGGIAAASFVKNTKNKALVQGGFEAASSLAAFATGNIPGGIGHAAAASMFFALAGKSGGGKKGGQQATTTGALTAGGGGSSGLSATGGSGAIVVNVQGFALGSAREMGAKMAQTIDQARETGLDSSEV